MYYFFVLFYSCNINLSILQNRLPWKQRTLVSPPPQHKTESPQPKQDMIPVTSLFCSTHRSTNRKSWEGTFKGTQGKLNCTIPTPSSTCEVTSYLGLKIVVLSFQSFYNISFVLLEFHKFKLYIL